MQTHFTSDQLKDPAIARADSILRSCVHCGFCTATCPTFVVTGDERDSPRGRIWMMRELLENPESISADTGYHLDRCLGCLSCTTTCPSGVDYPHLLDIGRAKMDKLVKRTMVRSSDAADAGKGYPLCWPVSCHDAASADRTAVSLGDA